MEPGATAIRTVSLPHRLEPPLFRALLDLRHAVNSLVPDWKAHPEESRFEATKRTYPLLRTRYGHLAAGWPERALRAAQGGDVALERGRQRRPSPELEPYGQAGEGGRREVRYADSEVVG